MTRTLKALALLVVVAAVAGAGCTVKKQEAPPLSGPSELGTALAMYATPDTLRAGHRPTTRRQAAGGV